jgi:predicted nucleotidyltransferase
VDDNAFVTSLTGELASQPGVVAVALGGSRAQRTHRDDSDWDFAVYYRDGFSPDALRAKGWEGEVSEIGGWGGGVMNGGAWLTVDGRKVDVHYRDLGEVEHWCREAEAGRFRKELLLFYVAGIPTYVVMAELAINEVLAGALPSVEYPDALSASASERWRADARASVGYALAAAQGGDVATALANASRAVIEVSHGRLAAQKTWVLNEKGIAAAAGLDAVAQRLLVVSDDALTGAIERIAATVEESERTDRDPD